MSSASALRTGLGIGAFGLMGYAAGQSVYRVPEGHVAVLLDTQKDAVLPGEPAGEGVHLRVPFRDAAFVFDVRPTDSESLVVANTKDGMQLDITLGCRARVNASAESLRELLGMSSEELLDRVVPATATEAVRHATGTLFCEEILGEGEKRAEMFRVAEARLREQAATFHVQVEEVTFPRIDVPIETQRRVSMKAEHELDDMLAKAAREATPTEAEREHALDEQLTQALSKLREGEGSGSGGGRGASGSGCGAATDGDGDGGDGGDVSKKA
eukprot:g2591.t1